MKYKKSLFYVQRQTNIMFKFFKHFIKTYMNDIIIYNKIFDEHLNHLRQIFDFFITKKSVSHSKKKFKFFFCNFVRPTRKFFKILHYKIQNRSNIIVTIFFNSRDLKMYFDLKKWLKSSISRYVQRANFLYKRKIVLIQKLSENIKKRFRKKKIKIISYGPIYKEHFNFERKFYVDLNVFKIWKFAAMIYHVIGELNVFVKTAIKKQKQVVIRQKKKRSRRTDQRKRWLFFLLMALLCIIH